MFIIEFLLEWSVLWGAIVVLFALFSFAHLVVTSPKVKQTEPKKTLTVKEMNKIIAEWTVKNTLPRKSEITEGSEYLSKYMPR